MSDAKQAGIFVLTHEVEMDFQNLYVPRQYKGKGDAKYDAMFVFDLDHPDLPALKALCGQIAQGKFPGVSFKDIKFPIKLGDKIANEAEAWNAANPDKKPKNMDHVRGKVCITARSQYAPRLCVNAPGRGFVDFREEAKDSPACKAAFYRGVRVLAELNFVANKVDENHYVSAYLNMVGSLNKGERRGGGKSGSDTFKSYVGHISADDPTTGMNDLDDEIHF
jgi:hypothetical protein